MTILSQKLEQVEKEPFTIDVTIDVYGPKKIEIIYSKRYVNGKEFGQFNDFQHYENLDSEDAGKFLFTLNVPFKFVNKNQRCKSFENYVKILKAIEEGIN